MMQPGATRRCEARGQECGQGGQKEGPAKQTLLHVRTFLWNHHKSLQGAFHTLFDL